MLGESDSVGLPTVGRLAYRSRLQSRHQQYCIKRTASERPGLDAIAAKGAALELLERVLDKARRSAVNGMEGRGVLRNRSL